MGAGDLALDVAADCAEDNSIRPLVRFTIVLVIVNIIGIHEARYVVWGQVTTAHVIASRLVSGGAQNSIEYIYRDVDNAEHHEFEHVPAELVKVSLVLNLVGEGIEDEAVRSIGAMTSGSVSLRSRVSGKGGSSPSTRKSVL